MTLAENRPVRAAFAVQAGGESHSGFAIISQARTELSPMQSSPSALYRRVFYGLAGVAVLLTACRPESAPDAARSDEVAKPSSAIAEPAAGLSPSFAQALANFNRGAALLEQYQYTKAAEAFEAVLATAPDWPAARFNLGVAYLNMEGQDRKTDRFDAACQAFDAVLNSNPQSLHARFCRGLCYQHLGDNAKALECFEAVYQRDKDDPCVAYKCAESLIALGRNEDGVKMLERSLQLDPGFVSAAYRLALQYQRTEQTEKADALFQRFKDLSAAELTGGTVSVQKMYGMAGKYYFALGADSLPLPPVGAGPIGRVVFSPEIKRMAAPAAAWAWSGGTVGLPGIAVGDLNADGHLDLVLSGIGGEGSTAAWINDGAGRFAAGHPFATHGIAPCLGDVDNAGRLDLWLGTAAGSLLFRNDGKGNFSRRAAPGLPDSAAFTAQARLQDIDCDGDLDLLAFRLQQGAIPAAGKALPAKSSVYRNNRDGSYTDVAAELGLELADTPVAAVVSDDFDNDGDLDLVIFPANGKKPIAWVNDRAGKHHLLDASATGLDVEDVISATSGDPNKDGKRDLLVFARNGVHLYINRGSFRFEEDKDFWTRFGRLGGTGGQFADMRNDGNLDIVIADAHRNDGSRGPVLLLNDWPRDRFLDAAELDPGILLGAIQTKGDASCVVADFCGKGRCDILLAPAGDPPMLIENVTPGGHWIELDLVGAGSRTTKPAPMAPPSEPAWKFAREESTSSTWWAVLPGRWPCRLCESTPVWETTTRWSGCASAGLTAFSRRKTTCPPAESRASRNCRGRFHPAQPCLPGTAAISSSSPISAARADWDTSSLRVNMPRPIRGSTSACRTLSQSTAITCCRSRSRWKKSSTSMKRS